MDADLFAHPNFLSLHPLPGDKESKPKKLKSKKRNSLKSLQTQPQSKAVGENICKRHLKSPPLFVVTAAAFSSLHLNPSSNEEIRLPNPHIKQQTFEQGRFSLTLTGFIRQRVSRVEEKEKDGKSSNLQSSHCNPSLQGGAEARRGFLVL